MSLESAKSETSDRDSILPSHGCFETRVTRIVVVPRGEPLFSEQATTIEIDDEAAGEFVMVTQDGGRTDMQKWILLNKHEWPTVRDAIDMMISQCREDDCGA